ncbi:ribonuclease H, partial [Trifolium pratense]
RGSASGLGKANLAAFHPSCKIPDGWGPQCKLVIIAAIINIINAIWFNRNQCRFNNAKSNLNAAFAMIIASTSISGNATKLFTSSAICDFCVLKAFKVDSRPPRAPSIKEVFWVPPNFSWTKCNTDAAALGCPGQASCAGVFRDKNAIFLGCFTVNLCINTAFHAELIGVMFAMEIAFEKGWWNLWVETDSLMVTLAFNTPDMVPWYLRNRWLNCLHISKSMNFIISHIFREGNSLADKLASLGLHSNSFIWHSQLPSEAIPAYNQNRFGLPLFRFT